MQIWMPELCYLCNLYSRCARFNPTENGLALSRLANFSTVQQLLWACVLKNGLCEKSAKCSMVTLVIQVELRLATIFHFSSFLKNRAQLADQLPVNRQEMDRLWSKLSHWWFLPNFVHCVIFTIWVLSFDGNPPGVRVMLYIQRLKRLQRFWIVKDSVGACVCACSWFDVHQHGGCDQ